jgi:hypothetical protein
MSVYELECPADTLKTRKQCRSNFDEKLEQVAALVCRSWAVTTSAREEVVVNA